MLNQKEKYEYLHKVVIPDFLPLVNQKIYSVIYDYDCKIAICTNYSAQSIAMQTWKDAVGISFSNHRQRRDLGVRIFGSKYTGVFVEFIHHYIEKIYQLQLSIFRNKNVVNFIDLLPYNDKFIAYLITYVPIFHPAGDVIGIQSFATSVPFFSHHDYMQSILGYSSTSGSNDAIKLTEREHEILFLLANSIPPEQMTQILGIRRSTISNIIANQISKKFGLIGSNSKLLTQLAIEQGYHKLVPESLSKPYIIILDEKLAKEINLKIE
jgi:DNA-binding CsgD family transcriptional regulator